MHIKTLTIQGFKSYKDQVAIEPFSPGHNVVVGRNGSGKSNFFSAIRFVLSDAYTSMSREERQALLHDSSNSTSATLSAFVEIVFDNSDHRFPTNGDEVILRRTIGLKKDEYSIDRRSATKADVQNLLEAAGFSRSNPYYIVPQGRITHLTNAKDHERLGLLKEVAGTRVYEQRRAESLKLIEDTEVKRGKIDDLLQYIEERLSELDDEKEELEEFNSKDRERRCLEYAIYQREMSEVVEVLDKLEDRRFREAEASASTRTELNEQERTLARLDEQISKTQQALNQSNLEKIQLIQERRDLSRLKAQLEVILKDLQEAGERTEEGKGRLEQQLQEIDAKISEKEGELMGLVPEWEDKKAELNVIRSQLENSRARVDILRAKQGRSALFSTKADRDEYLNQQLRELEHFEITQGANLKELSQARAECAVQIEQLRLVGEQTSEKLDGRRDALEKLGQQWISLKRQRDELMEEKKELWREEARLSSNINYARDQLSVAQRQLAGSIDRATASGLQAVERIARDLDLTGSVYGPLYQLFKVDDKYKTAVEVTANASLFHVVVDTDETASRLLQVMNQERSGRVTFMPLNRLKPKTANFPDASDAILMIKKVHFQQEYTAAFEQVFGRTIICPSLEIASAYVRSHNINAITLDGDQVDRKGSLTGGYHDPRRSRLDSVKAVTHWRTELDRDSTALTELNTNLGTLDQRITMLMGQIQTIETRRNQTMASRTPLLEQLNLARRDEAEASVRLLRLEKVEADLQVELQAAKTKKEAMRQELGTDMVATLSSEEVAELSRLTAQINELTGRTKEAQAVVTELANKRSLLEIDLNEDLKRHRSELAARIELLGETLSGNAMSTDDGIEATASAGPNAEGNLELRSTELKSTKKQLQDREKRAAAVDKELEELEEKLRSFESEREEIRTARTEAGRDVAAQQKNAERYLKKRQGLMVQRDECLKKIRDLGILPEEAFEKYTNTAMDKLLKSLHKINEALKKFAHVNKKAVEQYNNFTRQRDQLQERKGELEASADSIQELIDVLDQRKDEAIERTFKQVSRNFAEVFEKLVPAGRGRLIMQKRIDEADDEKSDMEEDEDAQESRSKIDSYTGVSIKVSFNSKSDEGLRIQQLSGGQKSLVALATVFAIQKCDPAPFYLFDEIDANLDAQYRTSVAAMIHELSDSAQFITTTFRPEMVATAEKHYGVLFNAQKISSIRTITKDEASQFVEAAAEPAR
ncbi:Structural maintenance of chromosomes protein 3 [Tilletia horrida]|uniref:Structural maintenance of chromosomes protein n=1 Tax=Tilletia horrida TaxID=155126 RepID=A0AAN6GMX0_9BASI|nr:Structural maintenance of chromosomes protein 3 [Tilletia horrida]KAK0548773.1 Structural maintenance of chromosomes protein 3 [Tilletia horrida]KAK0568040.1 Structural maintenance of chromosomes protein 3 [Tilletia horrida]